MSILFGLCERGSWRIVLVDEVSLSLFSFASTLEKLISCSLRRQYQTSSALAFESYEGSAQSPVSLPNGTNIAALGTIYASSTYPGFNPYSAVDGNIGGYPGNASAEWASNGEKTTAWWGVAWDQPYSLDSVSCKFLAFASPQLNPFSSLYRLSCTTDRTLTIG